MSYDFRQTVIGHRRETADKDAAWERDAEEARKALIWNIMESVRELRFLGVDLVVTERKSFIEPP